MKLPRLHARDILTGFLQGMAIITWTALIFYIAIATFHP